jgi:hypothetical protein
MLTASSPRDGKCWAGPSSWAGKVHPAGLTRRMRGGEVGLSGCTGRQVGQDGCCQEGCPRGVASGQVPGVTLAGWGYVWFAYSHMEGPG